jgi:aerobic carbon-monoxide dehydrogenase small subunit
VRFVLNGNEVEVDAHPMRRLLDVLREDCGLTGTKEGCGEGECGACTVLMDGEPVCACLVPFGQAADATVLTIEGLGGGHPLQRAFGEHGGAQCGICTPGMILAALNLGERPSLEAVKVALAGNLCRCTGYEAIYRSVLTAYGVGDDIAAPEVIPASVSRSTNGGSSASAGGAAISDAPVDASTAPSAGVAR